MIFLIFLIFNLSAFGEQDSKLDYFVTTKNSVLLKKITKDLPRQKISYQNIKKYLIDNNYFQFNIIKQHNHYIIKNPVKTTFVIKGARAFKYKLLKQVMKANEAQLGINFYETLRENIKSFYHKKGFQQVQVRQKTVRRDFNEWIYFYIKEGAQIRISKIIMTGLFSKPSSEYIDFIIDNSTPLIKKGFYNKKDLEIGYKNLLDHLKKNGFLQSKIHPHRVVVKNNLATVKVFLEEGPLTIIKSIQLKNIKSLPQSKILSLMKSKIQSPLRAQALEDDLKAIENFYKNNGFLNVKIKDKNNIIQYRQEKLYANLNITVEENKQSIVSKVFIKGIDRVKEEVVQNLLSFKVGEPLTLKKINETRKKLSSLELFSQIRIAYQNNDQENTQVTVHLTERKPRSFKGTIGLNTEKIFTARSYTEFSYNNLFGYGRGIFLQLNLEAGFIDRGTPLLEDNLFNFEQILKGIFAHTPLLEYEVAGRYKEIFIPGKGIEGNINVSTSKDVFNYSVEAINIVYKNQLSLFIKKNLGDSIDLRWNLFNFEDREEGCLYTLCPKNLQRIGSSSFTFEWDNRDSIFNPQKGFFFSLSGELASPFLGSSQNIDFWKMHFQQQMYYTLDQYTLALAFKGGLIQADHMIPVSRAFILGGQTSIRGYDGSIEGERIPSSKSVPIGTANESFKLKIGAGPKETEEAVVNRYALTKLEFRFPISKTFKGLVFYDVGLSYIRGKTHKLTELGHSIGIGARYETLFLPIGLDIGYKLPPKEGIDYRFHFSIGLF